MTTRSPALGASPTRTVAVPGFARVPAGAVQADKGWVTHVQ
jgi:hypothetical protein